MDNFVGISLSMPKHNIVLGIGYNITHIVWTICISGDLYQEENTMEFAINFLFFYLSIVVAPIQKEE